MIVISLNGIIKNDGLKVICINIQVLVIIPILYYLRYSNWIFIIDDSSLLTNTHILRYIVYIDRER